MRGRKLLLAALALTMATQAFAGWKIMPSGVAVSVAKSTMMVTPKQDWNRWSYRPSKKGEIWTLDGTSLNELSFFAQITNGEPLFREQNKKDNPLPKFKSDMLPTDLVELFEASNRIILQTSVFSIDSVEPAKLAGRDGVRFSYHYAAQDDELNRKGEGIAANIDGKLYMVNFVAPTIHYFDRDIAQFRTLVGSIKI
jgi:hypothetical protein